jgi:uncharacterized protein YodC (DUF2158 family)
MSFKVGDMVKLKSGGPDMTVMKIGTAGGEPMVWCVWFEGTKDAYGLFPPEALKASPELMETHEALSEPAQALEPAEVPPPEPQPTETDGAPTLPKTKRFTWTFSKPETQSPGEDITPATSDPVHASQETHPTQTDPTPVAEKKRSKIKSSRYSL